MPNPTLNPEMRVRRIAVLDTDIDDQTVMMDIEQGCYFGLNKTGTRIWSLLAEPRVISSLCDQLVEEFHVPKEECEQQVVEFLNGLFDRGLLQVVTDETT